MAGLGYSGSYAKLSPPTGLGRGGAAKPAKTTAEKFKDYSAIPQPTVTPAAITQQMDYLNKIPTGYTPEQELAMRNRIRSTDTAQTRGSLDKVREMMAASGLGGSGAELGAFGSTIRGQNAMRQGALSNLDLSNAQLTNQNVYNKAGMMNQLTGMGEGARQFDLNQAGNMYQYGTSQDEDTRRYNQQRYDYQQQLAEWLKRLNMDGTRVVQSYPGN